MKPRSALILGWIIFILVITVTTQANEAYIDRGLFQRLEGVWLRDGYIEKLLKMKTPVKAASGLYDVNIEFLQENGVYKWLSIKNFHESLNYRLVGLTELPDKTGFKMILNIGDQVTPLLNQTMKVDNLDNPRQISYFNGKQKLIFRKINQKTVAEFVNQTVLAGKYTDHNGRVYIFAENMKATWPAKTFTYRLNLDCVFDSDDYICAVDQNGNSTDRYYAFEWRNGKLLIYNAAVQSELIRKKGRPVLELTKAIE